MKRLILTIALAGAMTTSAAGEISEAKVAKIQPKMAESVDRFTGFRLIKPRRMLPLDKTGLLTTVELLPLVAMRANAPPDLLLEIRYQGYGWAFLTGALDILIDGTPLRLHGLDSTSNREVLSCGASVGCINEEVIRVPIDGATAERLAHARSAEVRAVGDRGSVSGELNEKHIAYLRSALASYRALAPTQSSIQASPPAAPAQLPAISDGGPPAAPASADSPAARAQLISSGMGCGAVHPAADASGRTVFQAACPGGAAPLLIDCSAGTCRPR